jgi:XTP/dITP diphosphohydrolase
MERPQVVLASANVGKLREFATLLQPLGLALLPQRALGVDDADEPHPTFVENALAKARHAAALSGLPALADDSGLCVPALGGLPGVRSARFAELEGGRQSDAANNALLVRRLAGQSDRRAWYYCVLVLMRSAEDPQPIIVDARWDGQVLDVPRGQGGFGYDPHFLLPSLGLTAAELMPAEKNRISHRGRAMQALAHRLAEAGLTAPP